MTAFAANQNMAYPVCLPVRIIPVIDAAVVLVVSICVALLRVMKRSA